MPTTLNGENGKEEEEPEKKSKERREKDRKALRMRRINSLKRQISIKEKMLEVGRVARATNYLLLSTSNPELQQTTNISHRCIHLLPDVPVRGCSKCKYKSYLCKHVQT